MIVSVRRHSSIHRIGSSSLSNEHQIQRFFLLTQGRILALIGLLQRLQLILFRLISCWLLTIVGNRSADCRHRKGPVLAR